MKTYQNSIYLILFVSFCNFNLIFSQDNTMPAGNTTETQATSTFENDSSLEDLSKINQAQKDVKQPEQFDKSNELAQESEKLSKVGEIEKSQSGPVSDDQSTTQPAAIVDRAGDISESRQQENTSENVSEVKTTPISNEPENVKQESDIEIHQEVAKEESKTTEKISNDSLKKIELQESINALFDNEKSIKDVAIYIQELRSVLSKIDAIIQDFKIQRDSAREIYHEKIDKFLDGLLIDFNFEQGVIQGKNRLNVIGEQVKTESVNGLDSIKNSLDNIDILEDKILEVLVIIDKEYERAVKIGINAKKLNFENLDEQKVEELKKDLQKKLNDVQNIFSKFKKESLNSFNQLIASAENLIATVVESFGKVKKDETEFGDDSNVQSMQGLEAKSVEPVGSKVESEIVNETKNQNKILGLYENAKSYIKDFYINLELFFKNMAKDIKGRAEELKKSDN
ncbi:hypothetical protein KJ644_00705 [Candidatus Dependentiae bacterium]|nr:hypothetical protein [Candidatus Dependentiae bacterium]MBU4386974.1 hypothetical protein [Candidatus Dependentiae bacterium]